jgi:RNA polymerase sigma factor (sigma-70 family)
MTRRPDPAELIQAAARTAGLGQRSDPDLLSAFLDRNESTAFEALVRRHGPLVLSACRHVLRDDAAAEDAFQATFTLLYRTADSIRHRPSLAGWLFRVARRCATNVRRAAERRERREARAARRETTPPADASWREALAILHEELDRLPERYRLPLIHCYLQGLSRDEAARRLDWTLNEVRGRLERGRVRLRTRLEKRGITLSAGLLAAATTSADTLPRSLLDAIHQSVQAPLATLRHGPVLVPSRGAILVAGALAVAVLVAFAGGGRDPQDRAPVEPPKIPEPVVAANPARATVAVRVLDPEGKPFRGAKLHAFGPDPTSDYLRVPVLQTGSLRVPDAAWVSNSFSMTDIDGRGSVTVPTVRTISTETSVSPYSTTIVATADGYGPGWWFADAGEPPKEFAVRLVKDLPIRGRLLHLEGKPAVGVSVRVVFTEDRPLELKGRVNWPKPDPPVDTATTKILYGPPPGAPAHVLTDKDGRFTLTGLGRDRLVLLRVSGAGVADETIPVFTNTDVDVKEERYGKPMKSEFVYSLVPVRPIRGTVRDAANGTPVEGVVVREPDGRGVTTNRDGRYELPVPVNRPEYPIRVDPAEGIAYFPTRIVTPGAPGAGPLTSDVNLHAGVPVRGRVIDGRTKKPISGGVVTYAPLAPNPAVRALGDEYLGPLVTPPARVAADGTFRLTALPGPGALLVEADPYRYPAARVDPTAVFPRAGRLDAETSADRLILQTRGGKQQTVRQEQFRAVVLMDVEQAKPPGDVVITLTPADPIRGRVLDPDGKPLAGARVRGLMANNGHLSRPLPSAGFEASPLNPDRPRHFYIRHDARKLAGTVVVFKSGTEPIDVTLRPWGSVTGRVREPDGKPAQYAIRVTSAGETGPDGKAVQSVLGLEHVTNRDGTFRIDGLIPGVRYEFAYDNFQDNSGRQGTIARGVEAKEGETKDLGETRMAAK